MDRKRKCPSKACYCALLTLWLVVALLVFLVSSSLYLGPLFRVLRYRTTLCEVQNTFFTTQFVCRCGSGCKSSYPCMLIHVSLNITDGEQWTVALYEDEVQQTSVVSEDQDRQEWCSMKVCNNRSTDNHQRVTLFNERYGQRGSRLPCAYDPWDIRAGAVINIRPVTLAVFHAIFWPVLAIVVGVTLCIIFCRRCQQDARKTEIELTRTKTDSEQLQRIEEGPPSDETTGTPTTKQKRGLFKKHKSFDTAKRTRVKGLAKSKSMFQ